MVLVGPLSHFLLFWEKKSADTVHGSFRFLLWNQLSFGLFSSKRGTSETLFSSLLGVHCFSSVPTLLSLCGHKSTCMFHFYSTASDPAIIWTKTIMLIPLNGLLAPATNLHSLKLFIEFMCHLGFVQTAGVTLGSVVTSDGALPETQLACVLSQM